MSSNYLLAGATDEGLGITANRATCFDLLTRHPAKPHPFAVTLRRHTTAVMFHTPPGQGHPTDQSANPMFAELCPTVNSIFIDIPTVRREAPREGLYKLLQVAFLERDMEGRAWFGCSIIFNALGLLP